MTKSLKIHTNDIKFLAPCKDKSYRLPHGIAVIDFSNIAYSIGGLPSGDRNTFILTSEASEEYINKVIDKFTSYIISLPNEIEKVIIFASNKDSDFYKLSVNKNIIPFEITEDDEKIIGYNRTSQDVFKSCLFYDDSIKNNEYPCTMYPKELLIPFSELPIEKQLELEKQADLLLHLTKLPKANKHKIGFKWNNYNRKSFCNYMRINDILRIFYINIIERVRVKINEYYSKTNRKIDIIHVSSPLEDDLTMRLYIKQLLNDINSTFNENLEGSFEDTSTKDNLENSTNEIKDSSIKDKEYSFYIYSNDRDVISNFSDIKNSIWISNYTPFTKDNNEEYILIDDFWNSLLGTYKNKVSDFSKRIIYGFLGSDYTTPIMNKYDIKRLNFKDRKNPIETLRRYINRRIIDGKLIYLDNDISDESIIEHVKYLSTTINNKIDRNLFICCFDSLIGFDSCYFHILTSNSIQYQTVNDYLKTVVLNGTWRYNWQYKTTYYIKPDTKNELKYKYIRIETKDGIEEIENNYSLIDVAIDDSNVNKINIKNYDSIDIKKDKLIKLDKIDSKDYTLRLIKDNPSEFGKLILLIEIVKAIKNEHSKELYNHIISKIVNTDAWKYILNDNQRQKLSKLISIKFGCLTNDEASRDYLLIDASKDSTNKDKLKYQKYKIDRLILSTYEKLRNETPEQIFTDDEIKELSIDEQYKIITRQFTK